MEVENNDNSDDDYEEEEFLVYLDFQSKIKSETLGKKNVKIKMIGFETDEPIVQVNNKTFRGVFEHAMGTNVFFSTDPNPPSMDPNFETVPSTMFEYHSQTNKVLKMERIFITPKQDHEEEDGPIETQNDEDVVPNESYSEALNHFLKLDELPPRTLSGSDVIRPAEFQAYFRPRLDEAAVDEQSEEIMEQSDRLMDSAESNDNNERTEADVSGMDESEPMVPIKIEKIKQEKG